MTVKRDHKVHQKLLLLIECVLSVLEKKRGFEGNHTLIFMGPDQNTQYHKKQPRIIQQTSKNSTKLQKINKILTCQ